MRNFGRLEWLAGSPSAVNARPVAFTAGQGPILEYGNRFSAKRLESGLVVQTATFGGWLTRAQIIE
jgi:hypothetical protein